MTTGPSAAAPPAGTIAGETAGLRLLGDLRAEIARADNKASILVGALGLTAVCSARGAGSGRLATVRSVGTGGCRLVAGLRRAWSSR